MATGAVVAAAYFGAAKLGLALAFGNSSVTAIWPPTGVALAALLIWGRGMWPAVAVGAFLANVTTAGSLVAVIGITTGNTLEAVVGAFLLGRVGFRHTLDRMRDVIALVALAAVVSTAVSALIGVFSLWADGLVPSASLASTWRVWWLGDMGGDLLVAPAILVLAARPRISWRAGWVVEAMCLGVVLTLASALIFPRNSALAYAVFPLLFWTALRFRQPGAAAAGLLVSGFAVWYTAHGQGPFVAGSPDGNLLRAQTFVGIATITALLVSAVRSEGQAASEAERRFAEAQQLAHLGSWEWLIASNEVSWSAELYRIYGVDPAGFHATYEGSVELVHPEDRDRVGEAIGTALTDAAPFEFEHRLVRPDGEVRTLHARGRVLTDVSGQPTGMTGTALDVTERKRHEAGELRLRASEERFRLMVEGVQDYAILMLDADGRVATWNAGAQRFKGYRAEEIIGQHFSIFYPQQDVAAGKPDRELEVAAADGRLEDEGWRVRQDGTRFWANVVITALRDVDGTLQGFGKITRDLTERRDHELQLQHLADHDPLTGLLNRRSFERELSRHIARVGRYGATGSVLILDLDNFKYFNDTRGHNAGDQLIVRIAHGLQSRLRDTDMLARLGGDEFAVLLPAEDEQETQTVAEALLKIVFDEATPELAGRQYQVSASIGIARFDDRERLTAEEMMVNADLAMYDAKEGGRNRISSYHSDQHQRPKIESRMKWAEQINDAINEDRFELLAQPIVSLAANRPQQYELLLRMRDPQGELIPPGSFLDIAERLGLIREIDHWVTNRAIDMLAEQHALGRDLRFEVNLSGHTIGDKQLLELIERRLRETNVPPDRLIFEITETAAIAHIGSAVTFAERLTNLGCKFALDDFGAGFGSFYYLKHLPCDYLKIDGEFVHHCAENETDRILISAVVQIARSMGKRTIAEFVTNQETVQVLTRLGVDYGQGFHLGRPAPLHEHLATLDATTPAARDAALPTPATTGWV